MMTVRVRFAKATMAGAAIFACFFAVDPANAQEVTTATCAADGRDYNIGDIACIPACHGQQRLARCELSGNAGSWTSIAEDCPAAMTPVQPGFLAAMNLL